MTRHRREKWRLLKLWRREDRWILAIVALALLLRVIYLLQARGQLYFNNFADSLYYRWWAQRIVEGQSDPQVFFQGPLYPYMMAFFYRIFGPSPEVVLWLQVLLGSASCGLIYLLGRLAFGRTVGLLAALMGALYAVEIFYEGALLMTTTLYFLNLLLLVSIFWALRGKSWCLWIVPGLLLGLSALGRANVLFFLPFLILGIFLLGNDRRGRGVRGVPAMLAVFLGLLVVITPVTVRNLVVGHDLVLITSNLGLNFFVGNNPDAPGYYEKPKGLDFSVDLSGSKIAMVLTGRELKPSEVSRFWLQRALNFVKARPGAFLRLTLVKFWLFWNAYEIPQAEDFNFFKRFASVLRWPLLGFFVLGPLGLLGMSLSLRQWREAYFLLTFVLSLMAVTVLFFVLARYRLQVCPVLMVFAAYALVWLWGRLRAKKVLHLAFALLVLTPMVMLLNRPHPALNPARDQARAHTFLAKYHWIVEDDLQKASHELEQGLSSDPHLGETYLQLAKLRLEQDRVNETFDLWRKAVRMDSLVSAAHLNVGNLYAQMGMWDMAIREYEAEIRSSPYNVEAYEALSRALEEKARIGEGKLPPK